MGLCLVLGRSPSGFDDLAATLAAAWLRPGAMALWPEGLTPELEAFADELGPALGLRRCEGLDLAAVDLVLCIEGARPHPLEGVLGPLARPEVRWEAVGPAGAQGLEQGPLSGALTTPFVEALAAQGVSLSPKMATALALGIGAATARLTGPQAGPRDLRAMAWLWEAGADRAALARWLPPLRGLAALEPESPEPNAAQLMSAPGPTLAPEQSLASAFELLACWGLPGAPVLTQGRVVGLLLRREGDRARRLGLLDQPVWRAMVAPPPTARPEEGLALLRCRMGQREEAMLLVVDPEARLLGRLTPNELLAEGHPKPGKAPPRFGPEALASAWGPEALALLREVGQALGDTPAFLVGGAVRDLVLGRATQTPDLDLVVEAPVEEAAAAIAQRLHPQPTQRKSYPGFGTMTVEVEGGLKLDLARARLEHYEAPGALPLVVPASLQQDLSRRDFKANALALALAPANFGQVVDPRGGLADVMARQLSTFHPLSFLEDPSRILRALRLEAQLGFTLLPEDLARAQQALEAPSAHDPPGDRYAREWRKLLGLEAPWPALERAHAWGAWGLLDRRLAEAWPPSMPACGPEGAQAWARLVDHPHWQASPPEARWTAGLALLLLLGKEACPEWAQGGWGGRLPQAPLLAQRWQMPREAQRQVALTVGAAVAWRSGQAPSEGEAPLAFFRGLAPLEPLSLAVLGAWLGPEVAPSLEHHLGWARAQRPALTGADLVALGLPPGPGYAELLDHLWAGKLTGRWPDRQAELHEAEAWLRTFKGGP